MDRPRNFFAILKGDQVRRIPLSRDVQGELRTLFDEQRAEFFAGCSEEVPFEANYTPEDYELLFIQDFQLPDPMKSALQNPLTVDRLNVKELVEIRGFFTGDAEAREVSLQVFDKRHLISTRGFSIVLDKNTFRKLGDAGLTLDTKLTAALREGRLFFRSFALARRLFDLSRYFREATDQDLTSFASHQAVVFEDPGSLPANADSFVRKKVALIVQSGILDKVRPADIVASAEKEFGLKFQVQTVGKQEKLVFPSAKKPLKQLLRFLDGDYLTFVVTGGRYLSSSKRRL